MMFLALNAGEITGIIGAAATVLTAFIIPLIKWVKRKKKEHDATMQKVLDKIGKLQDSFGNFLEDYESFTTQNFKYMINDAYFGYNNVHEIPDDVLTNACECCEIYVNKKHKNHEIRPRCNLLWQEQERRAISKEDNNEQ